MTFNTPINPENFSKLQVHVYALCNSKESLTVQCMSIVVRDQYKQIIFIGCGCMADLITSLDCQNLSYSTVVSYTVVQ